MDVGNDPFPRDEVTGLAAFENLEPVSSLSIEPEPASERETPLPTPRRRTLPAPVAKAFPSPDGALPFGSAAHPFSQSSPPPRQRDRFDGRGDPTMPLDLSAEADGGSADELFAQDAEDTGGWDNPDEATRVVTPSMVPAVRTADLQMDWDEDEPPTRMRAEGMLEDMPPSLGLPMDWDESNGATQIYDNQDRPGEHAGGGFSPSATDAAAPAITTLSGGRPSPFPAAPRPMSGLVPNSQVSGAPSPFATTAVGRDNWAESLRSGDKRTWIWAAAGALGLIVLALITRALVGGSTLGTLTVATNPADARVLIDGRPVSGTASPYALSDIAAGKHEMVVSKPGFVEYHGNFSLARGEAKTLPTVELVPSVREVGFSIRSAPPGAEIWVDGRAADQLTPARLTGVTPGIHRLQLKRVGYADFELQMFVPEATVLQLPTAELVLATPSKAVQPKAAAAVAHTPSEPSPSAALASGAAAERRAAAREARLAKQAARAPVAASPFAAATRGAGMPVKQPVMAAAPSGAAGGRTGTLRVNSRPWAQVFVDGRLMGNTPQPALQLSPGNHQIKLLNQPMGLSKTFTVSIKAGQMVTNVLNLAE